MRVGHDRVELHAHVADRMPAIFAILGETAPDQFLRFGVQVWRKGAPVGIPGDDRRDHIRDRVSGKRPPAGEHFVEARTPNEKMSLR